MKKLSTYAYLVAALLLVAPVVCGSWQTAGAAAREEAQVRPGTVPDRREARLFDRHVVRMGETAYSIARGYGLSPVTLAEDNETVDITKIRPGQVLLIRKRQRGRTSPEEVAREWARISESASMPGEGGADGRETGAATTGEQPPNGDENGFQGGVFGDFGRREGRGMRDFSAGGTPRVAMMLPLSGGGATTDFVDFYNGALLALEALKERGRSISLTVYDSRRSAEKVREIVTSAGFAGTDLIIGPVREDELEPAVRFGEAAGVPVVSPLASVGRVDSPTLYQMTPDAAAKHDKLRPLFQGDVNIVVVSSGGADDTEFSGEMEALLRGRAVKRFTVGQGNVVSLIDWERPNVLVVLGGTQAAVDTALKTVSSSYSHASATRSRRAQISVVGSSRWVAYNTTTNLTDLMFRFNTHLVTNYYINRWNEPTRMFEARYIEVYGDFPSRSAFRGYDAVALFGGALFESGFTFDARLERVGAVGSPVGDVLGGSVGVAPLGTPYRFVRHGGSGGYLGGIAGTVTGGYYTNDQWTLVSFSDAYVIETR